MSLILVFQNRSKDLPEVSDYNYEVLVGDGTTFGSVTIERGQVLGHRRSDGWAQLVRRVIERQPLPQGGCQHPPDETCGLCHGLC